MTKVLQPARWARPRGYADGVSARVEIEVTAVIPD